MKKISLLITILASVCFCSCDKFLDIVPDNVATIEHAFTMRSSAEKVLHTLYSHLPGIYNPAAGPRFSSDEITLFEENVSRVSAYGWYIAQGLQSATNPYNDSWLGGNGSSSFYIGIRYCNMLLDNVDSVPDMEASEKLRWKDEAKFLKAYFHFCLTRQYGPIPIVDKNAEIGESVDNVHLYRNSLDECFDYIVKTLDEILQDGGLPDVIENEVSELGRVTNCIVKAFKAQVLVYAASPLFNGNTDYKGYVDNRGKEIFCPDKTEAERISRWEKATDACREAIEMLERYGFGLYHYESNEYSISERTRYFLTRRGSMTDPENPESVWCYTNWNATQSSSMPFQFSGGTSRATYTTAAVGVLSVPIELLSQYYTDHGLPIEHDLSWKEIDPFSFRKATADDKLIIKPDYTTIQLHFNRDNRFYADIAFDGASWIGNGATTEASTYFLPRAGQLNCFYYPASGNNTANYIRKLINHKTVGSSQLTLSNYYAPIISMREMYLYYAEALNESGADWTVVVPWLNLLRARSGVLDVETAWDSYSDDPGKYKTKEGLREIIHQERTIELMFEGHRCWDQRRWKEAMDSFNHPISGWTYWESSDEAFFSPQVQYQQVFEVRDYFWPIKNSELYKNPNLVQNPGW